MPNPLPRVAGLSVLLFVNLGPARATPLDLPVNAWTRVEPTVILPAGATGLYDDRGWTMASYDSQGERVIVWEGYMDNDQYPYTIYSNSVWAFDAGENKLTLLRRNNWYNGPGPGYDTLARPENQTDPTPVDRHPAFVVVPDQDALYAFAGLNQSVDGLTPNHPDDTWRLDLTGLQWTELQPSEHPVSGQGNIWPAMAYEPSTRNVVIANATETPYGTTYCWLFDVDTHTYSSIPTVPSQGGNSLAVDTSRNLVWLFGGGTYEAGGNGLWRLDVASQTWEEIGVSDPWPDARIYHGFVYIPRHDVLVAFGGARGYDGEQLADTWAFSPVSETWSRLEIPEPVPGRAVDMAYDAAHNVIVAQVEPGQWWLLRYAPPGADVTAPAPPVSLQVQ